MGPLITLVALFCRPAISSEISYHPLPLQGYLRGPFQGGKMIVYNSSKAIVLDTNFNVLQTVQVPFDLRPTLIEGKVRFGSSYFREVTDTSKFWICDDFNQPSYTLIGDYVITIEGQERVRYKLPQKTGLTPFARSIPGYLFYRSNSAISRISSSSLSIDQVKVQLDWTPRFYPIPHEGIIAINEDKIAFVGSTEGQGSIPKSLPVVNVPNADGYFNADECVKYFICVADFKKGKSEAIAVVQYVPMEIERHLHPEGLDTSLRYRPSDEKLLYSIANGIVSVSLD